MVGSTLGVYSIGLIFVSARTNKRHHHHLHVRAARHCTATGADQALGLLSSSSVLVCLNDRVCEVAKGLQAAFNGGRPFAKLHLTHIT